MRAEGYELYRVLKKLERRDAMAIIATLVTVDERFQSSPIWAHLAMSDVGSYFASRDPMVDEAIAEGKAWGRARKAVR